MFHWPLLGKIGGQVSLLPCHSKIWIPLQKLGQSDLDCGYDWSLMGFWTPRENTSTFLHPGCWKQVNDRGFKFFAVALKTWFLAIQRLKP